MLKEKTLSKTKVSMKIKLKLNFNFDQKDQSHFWRNFVNVTVEGLSILLFKRTQIMFCVTKVITLKSFLTICEMIDIV